MGASLVPLLEYRRDSRQHLSHDRVRYALQLPTAACGEIESAKLVATDNPSRLRSGSRQGHSETGHACKSTAASDGQNHRNFRDSVERLLRYDQHGPPALLLVARRRIETDKPNFTALHAHPIMAHYTMLSIRSTRRRQACYRAILVPASNAVPWDCIGPAARPAYIVDACAAPRLDGPFQQQCRPERQAAIAGYRVARAGRLT
jgi:hypothetical protein